MKNIFRTLAIVALGFFATSCVSANVDDVQMAEGDGVVNFTVATLQADSRAIADGKSATDLTCAVYDANWNYLTTVKGTFTNGALTTTVSIRLVNAKTYNFVFWAEHPNNPHYTKHLGDDTTIGQPIVPTITVNYDSSNNVAGVANDETRDAFFGQLLGLTINGTMNEYVPLKRPFAQINFGTADTTEAKVGGFDITTATVSKFTTRAYTTLNLVDGDATGEVDVVFTEKELPVEDLYLMADTQQQTPYNWLAMNYILWPADEGSLSTCTMEITDNDATTESVVIKYPNAPVRRNWRTNLVGNLLTDQVVVSVEILPVPEGDILVDHKDGRLVSTAQDLVAAIAAAPAGVESKIKLEEDIVLTETIVIPADKIITINFNGHSVTTGEASGVSTLSTRADAASTYAFNNHGTLTLNGGVISARGIYNGYDVEGNHSTDATLVVNGTTINAIADNGGAGTFNYGKATINGGTFTGFVALNNRANATMVINNATIHNTVKYGVQNNGGTMVINNIDLKMGVANYSGNLTINGGIVKTTRGNDSHAIYQAAGELNVYGGEFEGNGNEVINSNSAVANIYGGTFKKVEKTSYLLAGSKMTIYGGTFYAHEENPAGHPVRPDVTIKGGTYNYQQQNLPSYMIHVDNGDGTYTVSLPDYYEDNGAYYIATAAGFLHFVNTAHEGMQGIFDVKYQGKTINLACDINCEGVEMLPFSHFSPEAPVTFDGQGYTLYNVDITLPNNSSVGLFAGTINVKNLNVDGAWVQGNGYVGVIGGSFYGNITNCHIKNAQVYGGYWQVGGFVGQWNGGNISGCSIENTTVNGPSSVGIIVGVFNETAGTRKIENCVIKDCAIVQNYSFGANYDTLFGMVAGYLNALAGIEYHFNNITIENSTLRGEVSELIYGEVNVGNVYIDGVQQ